MQKIFQVDLDIKNPQLKSVPPIEVVSGDTDTNIFNINLLENFKEVNASGNTAVITFVKSDGTTVFQNLTAVNASKGQYTCTLSSQTIVVPGRVKAEVSLYEGTKRLTSTRFEFNVRKAILDENTVESSNEFSALTQALSEVTDLKNLAGEGRTTETVKGNADDLATHKAENAIDAHGAMPVCSIKKTSSQSLANVSFASLAFESEVIDTDNMFDAAVNNKRITIKTAGVYLIIATAIYASNATGYRYSEIAKNGSAVNDAIIEAVTGDKTACICSTIINCSVNDYIELYARQSSGSALDVVASSQLMVTKVG